MNMTLKFYKKTYCWQFFDLTNMKINITIKFDQNKNNQQFLDLMNNETEYMVIKGNRSIILQLATSSCCFSAYLNTGR